MNALVIKGAVEALDLLKDVTPHNVLMIVANAFEAVRSIEGLPEPVREAIKGDEQFIRSVAMFTESPGENVRDVVRGIAAALQGAAGLVPEPFNKALRDIADGLLDASIGI